MKFVKSNFAKKLIIVLTILMILSVTISKDVQAWDLGGILMKPIYSLVTVNLLSIDVMIGTLLSGAASIGLEGVSLAIEALTDNAGENDFDEWDDWLSKLFVGPDSIFKGDIAILDANIFNVDMNATFNKDDVFDIDDTKKYNKDNILDTIEDLLSDAGVAMSRGNYLSVQLKKAISSIYVVLRNICAIVMLGGLIYTGIKILLSSSIPGKRSEWLKYLQDWLIGLVLLIFSHIIMIGIFYISDTLTEALAKGIIGGFGNLNLQIAWNSLKSFESAEQIINIIMLAYMIWLTIVFAISYVKRLMWVCILIILAPVVSVMYAFGQGTKRIYSEWLREYMTTVFVQPFHLVVYYVLITIPLQLTESSGTSVYSIGLR